jgi:hypothetical protein
MMNKKSVIATIGVIVVVTGIIIISIVFYGSERSLKGVAIFGAIFLPVIFIVRLIIAIIMALKANKGKGGKID